MRAYNGHHPRKSTVFNKLSIEKLEDRQLLATYSVNSVGDAPDLTPDGLCQTATGVCTLRAAIQESNALALHDSIQFQIPGSGPHTIQPKSALPEITDPITIDGYSQFGASPNTFGTAAGLNASIKIEINGDLITDGSSGLVIRAGDSTVQGLAITHFAFPDVGVPGAGKFEPIGGIVLVGGGNNRIWGNFIGTDVTGTIAQGNNFHGVYVGSPNNSVGGGFPNQRNLISGNQGFGVYFSGSTAESNLVAGNLIGTDVKGMTALGNTGAGVVIGPAANNNEIGGSPCPENTFCFRSLDLRNIISGNGDQWSPGGIPQGPYQNWPSSPFPLSGGHGSGVHVENSSGLPVPNTIAGNFIGTNVLGNSPIPNQHHGVILVFTNNVTVGGLASGAGNLISGNAKHGIALAGNQTTDIVIEGNEIGTSFGNAFGPLRNGWDGVHLASGTNNNAIVENTIANNRTGVVVKGPSGNLIQRNSIYSNALLGIDLLANPGPDADGPTSNDLGDSDVGANNLQNSPVLNWAQAGLNTHVVGNLTSLPSRQYTLEFFANTIPDPSGFGEGRRFLGDVVVQTDALGNATFNVNSLGFSSIGEWITATPTDQLLHDTSEFSRAMTTRVFLDDGTLTVIGTQQDDVINVQRINGSYEVTADFLPSESSTISIDRALVDAIHVFSRKGNDEVQVTVLPDPVLPPDPVEPSEIIVVSGPGNDILKLSWFGFNPNSDTPIDFGAVMVGGPGDDIVELSLFGFNPKPEPPVDLNAVMIGGTGDDAMSFIVDASASPTEPSGPIAFSLDMIGGSGNDTQNVDLVGDGKAAFEVAVNGNSGNDTIDVSLTDLVSGEEITPFRLLTNGGRGADVIDVLAKVGQVSGVEPTPFIPDMNVRGGAGRDQITVGIEPLSGVELTPFRLVTNGGRGADLILVRTSAASSTTVGLARSIVETHGGAGDDVITLLASGDAYETLLLDGGRGFDVGISTEDVAVINCEVTRAVDEVLANPQLLGDLLL